MDMKDMKQTPAPNGGNASAELQKTVKGCEDMMKKGNGCACCSGGSMPGMKPAQ